MVRSIAFIRTAVLLFKHREFFLCWLPCYWRGKYKADNDQKESDIELGNLKILMSTLDVPFNKLDMEHIIAFTKLWRDQSFRSCRNESVCAELQECVLLFQDIVNSFHIRIWKILVEEYLYNFILKWGEANYTDKVILPTSFKASVLYHLLIRPL